MSPEESFRKLMSQVRAGDQQALAQAFNRYAQRLLALARNRLGRLLRGKVDPEDVLQSVFQSFYCRYTDGRLRVESWDNLLALLTVMTLNKCGHRLEYFGAARRDVRREASPEPDPDASAAGWQAVARDPTPAQAAMLTDLVEHLMASLDERDRPVLVLTLQGHSVAEISEQIGRTERTVYRILDRIKKKVTAMRAEAGDGA